MTPTIATTATTTTTPTTTTPPPDAAGVSTLEDHAEASIAAIHAAPLTSGPPTEAARLLRPTPPGTETGPPVPVPPPQTTDSQLRWLPAQVAVYDREDGTHASYIAWATPDGTASVLALATRRIADTVSLADAMRIADAAETNLARPPIQHTTTQHKGP